MVKRSPLVLWNKAEIQAAIRALTELRSDMLRLEARFSRRTRELRANQRSSAANLIHYLALRGHDLRKLQKKLTEIGVCSLGRSEGQILDDMDRVLGILHRLPRSAPGSPASRSRGDKCASVLDRRTEELLGPRPAGRNVRIMVTAPSEAATNYELVHKLLQHGTEPSVINTSCIRSSTSLAREKRRQERNKLRAVKPRKAASNVPLGGENVDGKAA